MRQHDPPQATVGRGVVAGVAGTAVMTAFQKFIEMPITSREESYAPANFAAKILPIDPKDVQERQRLNWITHFALGAMWGAAFGLAGRAGLHGQRRSPPCSPPSTPAMSFSTPHSGSISRRAGQGARRYRCDRQARPGRGNGSDLRPHDRNFMTWRAGIVHPPDAQATPPSAPGPTGDQARSAGG
jgi:hypothetical protein